MVVLDTSFLIDLERGTTASGDLLGELVASGEPLRVPAAVWVEFLYRLNASQRSKAVRLLEGAASFEAFDRPHADEAARLQNALRGSGDLMGWHDLQVAATALHHDELLVTNDKGFERVPGLRTLGH